MTDNELIAEFMGFKKDTAGLYLMHIHAAGRHSSLFRPDQVAYNTSWDWLMPVVEKIEAMEEVSFDIMGTASVVRFYQNKDVLLQKIIHHDNSKITHVYKAVVEFIKWYNSNHPQP